MQRVTIEKMVFGGLGLARTGSGVLFVENGLPGEIVDVVPESKKHDCTVASAVKIVQSSQFRRQPPCKYAGICGGCDWLYIQYPGQLQYKQDIFIDCLKRIGKLNSFPDPEIFASPEFNYRIRAQIKVDQIGNCGFYRRKSNDIVTIEHCPLLCNEINGLLKKISEKSQSVSDGNLKIISGDNNLTSDPVISGITGNSALIRVGEFSFEVTGGSFFQSNRFLLEKLGTWAQPLVSGEMCIDLFGGTGFFSVMLSRNFKRGLLIESVKEQVGMAMKNYRFNGINNFNALHSTAEQIRNTVKEKPDLLIIDPPRPGLTKKAREEVVRIGSKKILYISCNPSTQARDINFLVNMNGYTVENMALFDLYPNTHHMETAMLLASN
ncbi:MAG TPA: class I SAM-dependent RNA methyltransferase [Chitinispirillaceae bacterium]|nr:class I SAM-dependent RNA methyltransferase [Chitinispirillaceae bacterium]